MSACNQFLESKLHQCYNNGNNVILNLRLLFSSFQDDLLKLFNGSTELTRSGTELQCLTIFYFLLGSYQTIPPNMNFFFFFSANTSRTVGDPSRTQSTIVT